MSSISHTPDLSTHSLLQKYHHIKL